MTPKPPVKQPSPGKPPGAGRRRAAITLLVFRYLGTLVSVVQGIVFIPLYLRFFSLSTYGAWLASGRMMGVLGHMDGGLSIVFGQRLSYTYGQQDAERFSAVAGSGMLIFFFLCGVLALAGLSLAPWVPGWVNAELSQHRALAIATALSVGGAALNLARSNLFHITRAWQLTLPVGVIRITGTLLAPALILVLLFNGLGVVALGLALMLTAVVTFSMASIYTIHRWRSLGLPRPRVEKEVVRDLLVTTGPMAVSRTVGLAVVTAEPTFVSALIDPRHAAVLSLTQRPYQVADGGINSLGHAVFSGLAHLFGESGPARMRSVLKEIFGYSVLLAALTLPLALVLNRGFINVWVGPDKYAGDAVNIALFIYAIAQTRNTLLRRVLTALGQISRVAWSSIAQISIRVVLMVTLVTCLGVIGVPLSFIGGFLLVSSWYLVRVLNRSMDCTLSTGLAVHVAGLPALATSLAVNLLLGWLLPLPGGWISFFVQLALAGGVTCVAVLLVSSQARGAARKVRNRVTRRSKG